MFSTGKPIKSTGPVHLPSGPNSLPKAPPPAVSPR